jgi:hypothetical protein
MTSGLILGIAAVLFWPFGATCVYLGAHGAS